MRKLLPFVFLKQVSQRGFGLIEVLVTLVILTGGLISLMKFQTTLFNVNSQAKQRSEATMRAQQKLDELRSYANLTAYGNIATGSDSIIGGDATYSRAWTITSHTTAPIYKEVAITVTWIDSKANTLSITLNSNIASNDPKQTGYLISSTTSTTTTIAGSTTTATPTTTTSSSNTTSTSTTTATSPTTTTTTTIVTTPTTTLPSCERRLIVFAEGNEKIKALTVSPSSACENISTDSNQKSSNCYAVKNNISFTANDGNGNSVNVLSCDSRTSFKFPNGK